MLVCDLMSPHSLLKYMKTRNQNKSAARGKDLHIYFILNVQYIPCLQFTSDMNN